MNNHLPERKPQRFNEFDYNTPAWYYLTMCTDDKKHLFGKVVNGSMLLNDFGKIVDNCWNEIPKHFANVQLDYYVIMPNHIHGIIILDVGDANCASRKSDEDRTKMKLPIVIQQFKRQCTQLIKTRYNYSGKIWQRSFYERIIRNEKELYQIRKYIDQNALKWELDDHIIENM